MFPYKNSLISKKMKPITPFLVMDIMEKAARLEKKGKKIIHLEVGEPDFDTPLCIKQAAIKAMEIGQTKYSHSLGIPVLREAICESYKNNYGVSIHPDQIIITSGTSPAMFLWFSLLLNPGDEVILSDPYYACYPNFIRFMGGKPVLIKIYEKEGFQYEPKKIRQKIRQKTKGIIINSPLNPTGTLLSPEVIKKIAQLGPCMDNFR